MVQGSSHNLSAFIEDYLQCLGGIELIPEDTGNKIVGVTVLLMKMMILTLTFPQ